MEKLADHYGSTQAICAEPCLAAHGVAPMDTEHREGNEAIFKDATLETSLYEETNYDGRIIAAALTRATQPTLHRATPTQMPMTGNPAASNKPPSSATPTIESDKK